MPIPSKLLTIREVVAATRLSKPTIYKMVRAGKFPRQVRLAEQRVAWLAAEIDGWIAEQAAAVAARDGGDHVRYAASRF